MENTFNYFHEKYGDEKLTIDEYKLIYKTMDKKKYSNKYIKLDRYIDLKRIKTEILAEKKKFKNNSKLKSIKLEIDLDCYPPYNLYKYEFHENKQNFEEFINRIKIIPIDDLLKSNY